MPKEIAQNGRALEIGREGCADMNELWGEHEIRVTFEDGTERIVIVYPSIRDYESSSIHIGKDKVKAYNWRYKVVK